MIPAAIPRLGSLGSIQYEDIGAPPQQTHQSNTGPIEYPMTVSAPARGLSLLFDDDALAMFLADHWPDERFVFHGDPSRFSGYGTVFDEDDVGNILRKIGRPVDVIGPDGLRVTCNDPRNALDYYNHHEAMIYLTGLDQYPAIRDLCDQLSEDLRIPSRFVTCEGFAARKGTRVPLHFDHETNFMIQIRGRKIWEVAENAALENPLFCYFPDKPDRLYRDGLDPYSGKRLNDCLPKDRQTIETGPGTVTFLPRGFWHGTVSLDDSFSIGFVIDPPTLLEIAIGYLSRELHSNPRWRAHPVYPMREDGGYDRVFRHEVRSLMEELAKAADAGDADDVVASYRSSRLKDNTRKYIVGS